MRNILSITVVLFSLSFGQGFRLSFYNSPTAALRRSSGLTVQFKDYNLEQAIRTAAGKPAGLITRADLESITELNLANLGLFSLDGIEHLVNLKKLDISGNNITDIAPLESLLKGGLQELLIVGNPLTIGDLDRLDIWAGSSRDMVLNRKLSGLGFSLSTIEGRYSFYSNGIYDLKTDNGYVVSIWANSRMVLNDSGISLQIDSLRLESGNIFLLSKGREIAVVAPGGLETVPVSLGEELSDSGFPALEDDTEETFFMDRHLMRLMGRYRI
ncbi:MAG: hypothetical protein PHQ54_01710 [Candidatus Omnitrophica bacterium]|nr:hypothetical protein [Candidatus Omnitrophota bacterium]